MELKTGEKRKKEKERKKKNKEGRLQQHPQIDLGTAAVSQSENSSSLLRSLKSSNAKLGWYLVGGRLLFKGWLID